MSAGRSLPAAAVLAAAAALAAPAAAQDGGRGEAAPRAASVSLCADQYLLALADRGQVATLSQFARGPYSWAAEKAEGLPRNRGAMEELLVARTDLLLDTGDVDTQMRRVLDVFGIARVELPMAEGFEGIARNLRRAAQALGAPERGEAMAAEMRARLAAAAPGPGDPRPRVVYYRPDGGGAGAGTFVNAALEAAGYRNVQAEAGQTGWVGYPAEALLTDPPEGYVISYFDSTRRSVSAALTRNPVLERAARERPVIEMPGDLWACPGPMLVEAVERLAEARARFAPPPPSPPAAEGGR